MPRNLAILIFDDVEVLDFCGPFEVFSVAENLHPDNALNVYTIAETTQPISTRGGMVVTPKHSLADCPTPDILLVPGGRGTRPLIRNDALLAWIGRINESAERMLSVCTGALLENRAAGRAHRDDPLRLSRPVARTRSQDDGGRLPTLRGQRQSRHVGGYLGGHRHVAARRRATVRRGARGRNGAPHGVRLDALTRAVLFPIATPPPGLLHHFEKRKKGWKHMYESAAASFDFGGIERLSRTDSPSPRRGDASTRS